MPTVTHTLTVLSTALATELNSIYDPSAGDPSVGAGPLRSAFEAFGAETSRQGIPLEDATASALEVLQNVLSHIGGDGNDGATMIAAGIALSALSRAHLRMEHPAHDVAAELAVPLQVARLRALHGINRAATEHLKLSDMVETTVRAVADATGADACAVFLFDQPTSSLSLRAAVGLNAASVGSLTIRLGEGITGLAALEECPIVVADIHKHPKFMMSSSLGEEPYCSQASVPMLGSGPTRLVGVLNILTTERRNFLTDEIEFLETVASELAISIENARLYSLTDARLRRKITEMGTLQRVSGLVASSLDLSDVLRMITEAAVELINAEAAAIFRMPADPLDADTEPAPTVDFRAGEALQIVNETRRNQLIRRVIEASSAQAQDIEYVDGKRILFCLPLRSARETLGALCLRLRPGAELTEEELGLLQAFSDTASIAIENAQLYEEARRGLERTSTLLQEMHHRVRNNLQTVAALLSLQIRQDPEAPWAVYLKEAVGRVQAIAAVHDLLSDEDRLGGATVDAIARMVAEEAHSTQIPPTLRVTFVIPPSDIMVSSRQATVLAIIVNELVSNAVSHGFSGRATGTLSITSERIGSLVRIHVSNDGKDVPEGFDPTKATGLGMRIVHRLAMSDLKGDFQIGSGGIGTVATLTFPFDQQWDKP